MPLETAFSLAGLTAMSGWLLLLASPWLPTVSDKIAGFVLPALLSLGYLALILIPADTTGGFDSLANVKTLFSHDQALLAGWVHFLAFDLFIGAWACRTARAEGIRFWWVAPSLPLIVLFGPAGLLVYWALSAVSRLTTRFYHGTSRPA
ncbi:ABA4-like family protein [Shimia sp.]|uniref:ABA4-like family protein n=1 Tax=Shimia sp. TaxID=1954381 RepID=UPI003BACCECA